MSSGSTPAGRAHTARVRACALSALMAPALAAAADILVFTRTEGFRHDSIPAGVALLEALGAAQGWSVSATDDPARFNATVLAGVDVVVWLNTTGDVLDAGQQQAFSDWVEAGGSWMGIHAAADCEYGWPWYGSLLGNGAWFHSHPAPQAAELRRELLAPSTAHLPERFAFQDEWYNFRGSPRGAATVLLSLDESSYAPGPGAMHDHPIAWRRSVGAGRAWYTGLGHGVETYADPRFVLHVAGGLAWLLDQPLDRIHGNGFETVHPHAP